jgi:hypothetical protein
MPPSETSASIRRAMFGCVSCARIACSRRKRRSASGREQAGAQQLQRHELRAAAGRTLGLEHDRGAAFAERLDHAERSDQRSHQALGEVAFAEVPDGAIERDPERIVARGVGLEHRAQPAVLVLRQVQRVEARTALGRIERGQRLVMVAERRHGAPSLNARRRGRARRARTGRSGRIASRDRWCAR